jgi:hypothetical protein
MLQLGPTGIKKRRRRRRNECELQRMLQAKKMVIFGPFRRTVRDKKKKT